MARGLEALKRAREKEGGTKSMGVEMRFSLVEGGISSSGGAERRRGEKKCN